METYVCGLCSDTIQAETDLFRQLNCSFRKCPGDAFHETCLTRYLKRHGHGQEQKTGYPCPAVLDNGETCSGTIRKTLTRVPTNEKKKQHNRQAAVVVNAILNTARVAKVAREPAANPAPTRIIVNANAKVIPKSTFARQTFGTMEPEDDHKPSPLPGVLGDFLPGLMMKPNGNVRNGGVAGKANTKAAWDVELFKATPIKLAVAKNAAMAPVQVVRQRLPGLKSDKTGKEYTTAEQREIAKALRAEALGMAGRGGHGASLQQQQTKSSGNAWLVSDSTLTVSKPKGSASTSVRSFDQQEFETASVISRSKAPSFESRNPYSVFSSDDDDSETEVVKATPISTQASSKGIQTVSSAPGINSTVVAQAESAGPVSPPQDSSRGMQISLSVPGADSAVGTLAGCVTPPITPSTDKELPASNTYLDGAAAIDNTSQVFAVASAPVYGAALITESDPIVAYEMLYEMGDTIVVLRDEGFVPVERIYANPEYYMFPDDIGNNACYVGIRQSCFSVKEYSEGIECLSGLPDGKVDDIQLSEAAAVPEATRPGASVGEAGGGDDNDLSFCLSLCLGGDV